MSPGAILHLLLEWTAVCAAAGTLVLAVTYLKFQKDRSALVVSIALFFSGCMDAFHALAAGGLIPAADQVNLIPFTWAICRGYDSFVLLLGGTYLWRDRGHGIWISFPLGLISIFCVYLATTMDPLPQTLYPNAFVSRPCDMVPLVMFAMGIPLYMRHARLTKSLFSWCLVGCLVSNIMAEFCMAFFSIQLFDAPFQMAHSLKVVAYVFPLLGLLAEYRVAFTMNMEMVTKLERSNVELEQFAYIASHDLQEPLRTIYSYVEIFREEMEGKLDEDQGEYLSFIEDASKRLNCLVKGLLEYSRVPMQWGGPEPLDLESLVRRVGKDLIGNGHTFLTVGPMPRVMADPDQIYRVLVNLLGNSMKYVQEGADLKIDVVCISEDKGFATFAVIDNGIGIDPEYHDQIFVIFKRLHTQDVYKGTGLGLSLSKKIIEQNGGEMWVESEGEGKGSKLIFTLPLVQKGAHPFHELGPT